MKLINLINESNVVAIYGTIGAGGTLLLGKLAHHPSWKGKLIEGLSAKSKIPPKQGNVFIFGAEFFFDQLTNQELQEWEKFFALARHNNQKFFLSLDPWRNGNLHNFFEKVTDLIILTGGLQRGADPNRKYTKIQAKRGDEIIKGMISFGSDDHANMKRFRQMNPVEESIFYKQPPWQN